MKTVNPAPYISVYALNPTVPTVRRIISYLYIKNMYQYIQSDYIDSIN